MGNILKTEIFENVQMRFVIMILFPRQSFPQLLIQNDWLAFLRRIRKTFDKFLEWNFPFKFSLAYCQGMEPKTPNQNTIIAFHCC